LGEAILTALEDDPPPNRLNQVRKVRLKKKFEAKLLAAVPVEKIRSHIPSEIIETAEAEFGELSDENIASLARAVFGVDLLKELSGELRQAGLAPPGRWAGGKQARFWVKQLGFPREFAGFEGERRDPLLEVDGPPDLPPLHTFQETATENLKRVVRDDDGNRGLMSLPTGAGKTRVTVQALVEMIRDAELEGPILWVAQTDELCEQGVRTWSEVWRAIGPNRRLAVSRLWSNNDVEEVADSVQIVVATISKLDTLHTAESGTRHERYKWLSTPTCVVIDEAHRSITPEYTRLLKWLEIDGKRRSRPFVGLTATPFRGTNVTETKRLVSRYGGKRIDEGAFEGDAYEELQESEVLAQVTHEVLAGQKIALSRSELAHLKKFHRLPPEVEVRIGEDRDRNRVLLDSITKLPEDWPVLVFASSVSHARSLAAVLTLRGKPSAAISSETPTAARRFFVEEFRSGAVKVLTNYAVFTEGFDAPAVRAVYVGRPTYSPNLYQQMIGRGLRGPKNGGKPECLLVDVADNIENYNGELAFTEFEGLWAGGD
jgi:superfamily II DNA or RNA helicase